MATAVPQVINHRMEQMAWAGASPSAYDWQEFHLMSEEKVSAFHESWNAMAAHAFRVNQEIAVSFVQFWFPVLGFATVSIPQHPAQISLDVISEGMAPYHRLSVANAERLGSEKRE